MSNKNDVIYLFSIVTLFSLAIFALISFTIHRLMYAPKKSKYDKLLRCAKHLYLRDGSNPFVVVSTAAYCRICIKNRSN